MNVWKQYENQVYEKFVSKYPRQKIDYNQKVKGIYSKVNRQIDILITTEIADSKQIGVFDCKKFNKRVDVKTVDSMVGYMIDLNANYGGIITSIGFTNGAINRAASSNIKLEIIKFENPEKLVDHFVPSLDFSDPRNSMYLLLLF